MTEDLDWRLEIRIGDRELGLGIGNSDWRLGIRIGDRDWGLTIRFGD